MDVKALTMKLIQQELGEWVLEVKFSGPFEGEDIDADVILKEKPVDLADRSYRIHHCIRENGFDVLIFYDLPDEEIRK